MLLPETDAVLAVRRAVRAWRDAVGCWSVAVAVSGGADSLALTAAAAVEIPDVRALVVDHRLQAGSDHVARWAAESAQRLGCRESLVLPVDVVGEGGPEAAARDARYAALDAARDRRPVLLGHTLDDQAETVLLGLARGSGGRSLRGMTAWQAPWGRPLLGVRRAQTRQMCADLGLTPWEDPHNSDPAYTRVRVRTEVLPLLEEALGGGVAAALARTAAQLREDGDVLDELSADLLRRARTGTASDEPGLSIETLATAPAALRKRAIRAWLAERGVSGLMNSHLQAIDALVTAWRGQGGVAVAGGGPGWRLVVTREHGTLTLRSQPRATARRPTRRETD
ncbi:tRNA lysidine(34) synthetase TilS [Nocardia thailandica]